MKVDRLKHWRERRALSQRELAERAGVRQATVWHIETGGNARPSTVRALALALEVSIDQLLGEQQPRPDST